MLKIIKSVTKENRMGNLSQFETLLVIADSANHVTMYLNFNSFNTDEVEATIAQIRKWCDSYTPHIFT